MDVQMAAYSSARAPFGARNSGGPTASQAYLALQTGTNTFRSDYFGSSLTLTLSTTTEKRVVIDKNKNVMTVNGVSVTNTAKTSGACSYVMLLFSYQNATSVGVKSTMTMYSCKIYEDDELLYNYIPCELSSGDIGLWDDVNGVFHGDDAGGVFVAGPVVDPMTPYDGHNTNIGNVAYEIECGSALVNDIEYELGDGLTLVDGVEWVIELGSSIPTNATVTFNEATSDIKPWDYYMKTTMLGTTYSGTSKQTVTVPIGTVLCCYVYKEASNLWGVVNVDGVSVYSAPDVGRLYSYDYIITGDIQVDFTLNQKVIGVGTSYCGAVIDITTL